MKAAGKIVSIAGKLLAAIIIIYSAFVLYDEVYAGRAAFLSSDLSNYKPVIDENALPSFDELKEINEDTRAWLTIKGTHIDYPVMQGKDDVEYASKDPRGQSTPSGSVYLATDNKSDFSDSTILLYGHHMDNGAIFGDISKYEDKSYFDSHRTGVLITPSGVFDIKIFGFLNANAYDMNIYTAKDRTPDQAASYLQYLKSLAVHWAEPSDIPKKILTYTEERDKLVAETGEFATSEMSDNARKNGAQLIVMSTCYDATTNGRQLLVGTMTVHEGEYHIDDGKVPLIPWGHKVKNWALLNLICVILQAIIAVHRIIKKRKKKEDSETTDENPEAADNEKQVKKKSRIKTLVEIILAVIGLIVFILTENMSQPMVIIDSWTILMIVLLGITLAVDVLQRKKKNEESSDS